MAVRQPKYTSEEAIQLGSQFYEQRVRPHVKDEDHGKFVSIDLESGEWEMDTDRMAPGKRLRSRLPDAQILTTRVGYGYAVRFGGASLRRKA
jgi:hypothetical protein